MKKNVKAKMKTAKPSVKSPRVESSKPQEPMEKGDMQELVMALMKIGERLESLEKKMNLIMTLVSSRTPPQTPPQQRSAPAAYPQASRPQHPNHQSPRQNQGFQQRQGNNQGHQQVPQPNQPQNVRQDRGPRPDHHAPQNQSRQGRPLFKAVCADCSKDCEVPFQPTAERPVYCKECFGKRKAGGHAPKKDNSPSEAPMKQGAVPQEKQREAVPHSAVVPQEQQRVVRVVANGVGKTTVREVVGASASAVAAPPKKKSAKLAKKSR